MKLSSMKWMAVLSLSCLFLSNSLFAQKSNKSQKKEITKDETVVLKNDGSKSRTVIEIKDGKVYVNGEAVVSIQDANSGNVHKKIIIENGKGDDAPQAFNFNNDAPFGQQGGAQLGVLTEQKTNKRGAFIKQVQPSSAAEKAGLKNGDLITKVDGKNITSANDLVNEIKSQHQPGDKVTIQYERNGKQLSTNATLQAQTMTAMRGFTNPGDIGGNNFPEDFFRGMPMMPNTAADATPKPKLGVRVEDRADNQGVRVLEVNSNSVAEKAGLQVGDVIMKMDGQAIASVDDLESILGQIRAGNNLKLEYQREGKTTSTTLKIPEVLKQKDL
ncbi:MAG: PDZ domain-containing protein [Chitinophagaceae bacterium]